MANYRYDKIRVAEPCDFDSYTLSDITEAFNAFTEGHGLQPEDVRLYHDHLDGGKWCLVGYREQNAKEREATRNRVTARRKRTADARAKEEWRERAEYLRLRDKYGDEEVTSEPPRGYYDDRTAREG